MRIEKGKPLQLPDGSIVLPESDGLGSKVVSAEKQAEKKSKDAVVAELEALLAAPFENAQGSTYQRTLADINMPMQRMNALMLVTAYSIWGLDAHAISRVLNISEANVRVLLDSDQHTTLHKELLEAIRYAEAATIHGYLTEKAKGAAVVLGHSLLNTSADVRLSAAKDILDRSGFRPADRVEHVHRFEDELRIRYVSEDSAAPVIDITPAEE